MVFHDVSEARYMAQQMAWQANHDSLTGLVNRREFERRLADLIQGAKLRHKEHALLYMDLDQFKIINDTCGHIAGDEMLKQLSQLLQDEVRESDTLARLGGDEFGILLAGCHESKALTLAENLRQATKNFRFVWDNKSFEVGASIGLVNINDTSGNISDILSAADIACYAAKDMGRNRVHSYRPNDAELAQRHGEMHWVSRIREALDGDRFVLYCQKIQAITKIDTTAGHYEILVRMLDENKQLVPPNLFIPAAERYNLMPSIDRWVIKNSFECVKNVLKRGGCSTLDTVSINLSGNTFSDDTFLEFVRSELNQHRLSAQMFCFEITETAAIANRSKAIRFMRELKKDGCRFSLDDFGSGLSSFAYLKELPVDYLKIDGGFVKDITDDPIDRAMVNAINQIGQLMNIKTIAEFVENDAILKVLRDIGVDYAQGYGIHRPTPLNSVLNIVVNKDIA
jgi:diguanylate cyclase (GGDEF)-like protein